MTNLGKLLLLPSNYNSLRESKYPRRPDWSAGLSLFGFMIWNLIYLRRRSMLTLYPAFTVSYFNLCDPFICTAVSLLFIPSTLLFWIPLAYCTQPPSHVQKHIHHPHVRHLPARWCSMLLVSELADMICQVLAAGTWGSRKHRHDLSSGAPVRVAVCTACVHTAATCIHTEKVYYQELHTHACTHLQQFCVRLNVTQNVVLWKDHRDKTQHTLLR